MNFVHIRHPCRFLLFRCPCIDSDGRWHMIETQIISHATCVIHWRVSCTVCLVLYFWEIFEVDWKSAVVSCCWNCLPNMDLFLGTFQRQDRNWNAYWYVSLRRAASLILLVHWLHCGHPVIRARKEVHASNLRGSFQVPTSSRQHLLVRILRSTEEIQHRGQAHLLGREQLNSWLQVAATCFRMHDGNIEPSEFLHLGCEEHILEMRGEKQFRYHVVWQRKWKAMIQCEWESIMASQAVKWKSVRQRRRSGFERNFPKQNHLRVIMAVGQSPWSRLLWLGSTGGACPEF